MNTHRYYRLQMRRWAKQWRQSRSEDKAVATMSLDNAIYCRDWSMGRQVIGVRGGVR